MTYDMNDAELPRGSDLIPDGSFVKVTMTIRKGGEDGQGELDRGLLKASKAVHSDVKSLDCEFTVSAGPHMGAGSRICRHGARRPASPTRASQSERSSATPPAAAMPTRPR